MVIAGSAATGAGMAVRGVNAWQKQMRGKAKYQIAFRCLRNTYSVRDALRLVRVPALSSAEIDQADKSREGMPADPEEQRKRIDFDVYNKRWRVVYDADSDLAMDLLEAEVLWPKIREAVKPLRHCIHDLQSHLSAYLQDLASDRERMSGEYRAEIRKTLFSESDDDPFNVKLLEAVKEMDDILAPHVRS